MIIRIKVVLSQDEYRILSQMAVKEMRTPSDQLRYLLKQELERRGLIMDFKSEGEENCNDHITGSPND